VQRTDDPDDGAADVVDAADVDGDLDSDDGNLDSDDDIVLPWYYSWWRVAAVAVGVTLLAVALVIAATGESSPDADSVDAGFLQDMRTHHDQAVLLSMIYMNRPDVDPGLYTMASEVLLSQQLEVGMFVELLNSFGLAEENSTGIGMAWMGAPVPLEAMPGMASEETIAALKAAEGTAADELFTRAMIAHHEGGISMAEYARDHAETSRVREIASAVATNQRAEINELNAALARAQASA
jgi:uncharacterized protein (DUF305 family)